MAKHENVQKDRIIDRTDENKNGTEKETEMRSEVHKNQVNVK